MRKRKEKIYRFCQLCGRVTSVKTPPHHRALSPWAYMCISTPSLSSLWTEDTDILLHRTSSVFCSESIRCEPMPLFRGGTRLCSDSANLYALGSVVSVPPLFSQRGRAGGAFIVSVTTLRHLARLFISLLRLLWWVSTKQGLGTKGGLVSWSEHPFFACEFVKFVFFLYVRTVMYFNVYVCFCV